MPVHLHLHWNKDSKCEYKDANKSVIHVWSRIMCPYYVNFTCFICSHLRTSLSSKTHACQMNQEDASSQLLYYSILFLSKKPPVGPLSGNVANQTAVSAPSSTDLGAAEPPMSVRTQPGSTAFTNMLAASLLSSFANIIVSTFKLDFDR